MATQSALERVDRRDLRLLALAIVVELVLLGGYVVLTPAELTRPRYALYPFVWINIGLWAVLRTTPSAASRGRRLVAGVVAGVYFIILCWLAGLVGVTTPAPAEMLGVSIGYGSPGWERVRLVTPAVYATLVPYRVIGYLALSHLVYVTVLDTAAAALSGALGFVSCLSCSFPILASLAAGVFGSGAAVTGALYAYSVDISTGVFVLAVGLLYYRPGFDSTRRQRME